MATRTHTSHQPSSIRLLVLNPNSSEDMTHGMEQAIRSMDAPNHLEITMYTAPLDSNSPRSINNQQDIDASVEAVWPHLHATSLLSQHDAVLVACYSSHPLVRKIATAFPHLAVTGIFEASVVAALPLLRPSAPATADLGARRGGGWGIVTTGTFWDAHLHEAVQVFLGQAPGTAANDRFRGVFTTGLDAGDFHGGVAPEVVSRKLKEATTALLATRDVDCVVMGCAGMAGLEDLIRQTVVAEYGEEQARQVYIVDGVRAGIGVLEQMVKNRRMFLPLKDCEALKTEIEGSLCISGKLI